MRVLFLFAVVCFPYPLMAQGTLSPTNPSVNPGASVTISCTANCGTGGAFTCPTCSGTLSGATSTSVIYTAPATVVAKQSVAGYQLLPRDHIFNTDISGLAAASNSATVMMNVGSATVKLLPSFPINYTNGSTPTDTLTLVNTPSNNGTFQSPQWPNAGIEDGWFGSLMFDSNVDHHFITADTTNGNLGERYQYYAQAPLSSCTVNGSNSATCTLTPTNTSSGFARAAALGLSVCVGGFTGGDTYLNICPSGAMAPAILTAATPTSITFNLTHASASTTTTGQATLSAPGAASTTACAVAGTCNSQGAVKYTYADYALPANGTSDTAGMFLEPLILKSQEFVSAVQNGGAITHALRMTLQNGFICGSSVANSCVIGSAGNATGTRHIWPATAESLAGAGTIPYGARFRLKASFNISTFSAAAQILLTTMQKYGVIVADGGLGWQITSDVDNLPATEAAALLEIGNANIATSNWEAVDESSLEESSTTGGVNNGEVISYTSSTGTVTTHLNLQGSVVNVGTNQFYIMAGTPAQQLTIYGNGTCSMSPSVGTLSSNCVYTPPSTQASATSTTVTVTSTANASVKAYVTVYILPNTGIRLVQGTADYTDSGGNVWYSSGAYGVGMANIPSLQGCCQNDCASMSITDKQLWCDRLYSSSTSQDYKIDLHVPAGVYQVTYRNGTNTVANGTQVRNFYAQGILLNGGSVDPNVIAGGLHLPFTQTAIVTVGSNNLLSFYNAGIGSQANNSGDISSISIIPGAVARPSGSLP